MSGTKALPTIFGPSPSLLAKVGAAKAAPTAAPLPPMVATAIVAGIESGRFSMNEMTLMRRALQRQITVTRKTGMIMAGATLAEGDRVMINDSYYFEADHLPKRHPKYAIDGDGLVHVGGDCVDLIPPLGSSHA